MFEQIKLPYNWIRKRLDTSWKRVGQEFQDSHRPEAQDSVQVWTLAEEFDILKPYLKASNVQEGREVVGYLFLDYYQAHSWGGVAEASLG